MRRFLSFILLCLLFIMVVVPAHGCVTVVERQPVDTSTETPALPVQNDVPPGSSDIVVSFTANPSSVMSGYASKLSWSCTGATAVRIDPEVGSVGLSGDLLVSPSKTTIYILTASNAQNSVTASTQVIVTEASSPSSPSQYASPPIIHVFTAEPLSVTAGQSAILSWDVSNASTIYIEPVVLRQMTSIPAAGSASITPSETTMYTLTALNTAGMNSKTVTVTVSAGTQVYLDWEGTWDTDWGMMYLTQSAGKVTGTYEHDDGKIVGYISKNMTGNILVGTWSEAPSYLPENNDAGDIEFIMSDDGNTFKGNWRYGSSGDWDGSWVGTRLTPKVLIDL
jgi:hypothetical protein